MSDKPNLIWFRRDLRLQDNPALNAACEGGKNVIALYVLDNETAGDWAYGGASRWWLHHSLQALSASLEERNIPLLIKSGDAQTVLEQLAPDVDQIYWNRLYEPNIIARDTRIKEGLANCHSYKGICIKEPWEIETKTGNPYKVYTPFKKACYTHGIKPNLTPAPDKRAAMPALPIASDHLDLLPDKDWATDFSDHWSPGEGGASARLDQFIAHGLEHYKQGRDRPDRDYTSRLSPHLHFGEISPQRAWQAAIGKAGDEAVDSFHSELLWREFAIHLLYYFPDFPEKPLQPKFAKFPWRDSPKDIKAWKTGHTGYPIVDAGMRQLWQTGWMHNRVRMIVGSLLVKHLLLPWQAGEAWFWDCLLDADLANNSAGWQWIGGCGADAAPYFRVFNPMTQGEKFDPDGSYVRQFVPELKDMPAKYIHQPWEAPAEVLQKANVTLGRSYPRPIIEHKQGRQRALDAFASIKEQTS